MKYSVISQLLLLVYIGGVALAELPPSRHLFLDPAALPEMENVALRVNPPERRELIIQPDRPWEQLMISFYLTILDEDGKLRIWYICRDKANHANVAYAESCDGVHWIKPNLGIVEYDGSKENNLVGLTSLKGVVCRDPNVPPEERYIYVTHKPSSGMVRFYSSDGLHWQRDKAPLLRFGADTQNVTFWDERLQKYVLYLRGWQFGPDNKKYRKIVRAELPNLTTPLAIAPTQKSLRMWGKDNVPVMDRELPTVFATDANDPTNTDVYNISAQPYPLDPRWYVGFPSIFQPSAGLATVGCMSNSPVVATASYGNVMTVCPTSRCIPMKISCFWTPASSSAATRFGNTGLRSIRDTATARRASRKPTASSTVTSSGSMVSSPPTSAPSPAAA